jgi:hypothetical protein
MFCFVVFFLSFFLSFFLPLFLSCFLAFFLSFLLSFFIYFFLFLPSIARESNQGTGWRARLHAGALAPRHMLSI